MRIRGLFAATAALALAACSSGGNDNGMVTVSANTLDGNVSVRVPGVSIDTKLPKAMFTKGDFDIDGVKLFPGSKIQTMDVNAGGKPGAKTIVDITFSSPASVEAVHKHFAEGFTREEVAYKTYGSTLTGKTSDGNDFAIDMVPMDKNQTMGHVTITGRD